MHLFSISTRPLLEATGLLVLAFVVGAVALWAAPASESSGGRPLPTVASVSTAEAMALAQQKPVLFVDARALEDYQNGHVAGAALLPFGKSIQDEGPLTVIVYCDDADCGKAETLARSLTERPVQILVMPEGVAGWFSEGGMLETAQ